MRSRNFLLYTNYLTADASQTTVSNPTVFDSKINRGDSAYVGATLTGESDDDPYGNVNTFVERNVIEGALTSIFVNKSAPTFENSTDEIDVVAIVARG